MPENQKAWDEFIENFDNVWEWDKTCPICRNREWSVGGRVITMLEMMKYSTKERPLSYPAIPVTCKNCGYTLFFNAIRAGIVEKDEENGEEDINQAGNQIED